MNELNDQGANHWKLGFIYYNPHNPKSVVPKRYGLGWTFNFAHKTTWLFLLAIVVIAIGVKMLVK